MSPNPKGHKAAHGDELPEFERPPLAEVALGIQFDPIEGMSAARLGTIWELFRDEFPRTEDRPPIATMFERFGNHAEIGAMELNLDLVARPSLPRCWFVNEAGSELLQVQGDRFHHNWRRTDQKHAYPRYRTLEASFEKEAHELELLLAKDGLGKLVPNQCEVTYINHITAQEGWEEHSEAGKVFRLLVDAQGVALLAQPEHVRFDTAFLIRDEHDLPRGRLHVAIASGFLKAGDEPMFAMTLTARGAPIGDGMPGAMKFLDLGHDWIVRGFTDLTTEPMHKIWGMKSR